MTNNRYYKYENNTLVLINQEDWEEAISINKQQCIDKYTTWNRECSFTGTSTQVLNNDIVDFYYYARFNGEKPNGSYVCYREPKDDNNDNNDIYYYKDIFYIKNVQMLSNRLIEVVFINDKVCVIDVSGGIIISTGRYDEIKPLSDKFLKVCSDSLWGVFDLCGNEIIPTNYSDVQYIDY